MENRIKNKHTAAKLAPHRRALAVFGGGPGLPRFEGKVRAMYHTKIAGLTYPRALDNRPLSKKRKSPDTSDVLERRGSPYERLQNDRTSSASRSPSVSSRAPTTVDVYNSILDATDDGFIFCSPVSSHVAFL